MPESCSCRTLAGGRCSKPAFRDYPFCGHHIHSLLKTVGASSFKRSKVRRLHFCWVDESVISDFLLRWELDGNEIPQSPFIESHRKLILNIVNVEGSMTAQMVANTVNRILLTSYNATQLGQVLGRMVTNGELKSSTTRNPELSRNKTRLYHPI